MIGSSRLAKQGNLRTLRRLKRPELTILLGYQWLPWPLRFSQGHSSGNPVPNDFEFHIPHRLHAGFRQVPLWRHLALGDFLDQQAPIWITRFQNRSILASLQQRLNRAQIKTRFLFLPTMTRRTAQMQDGQHVMLVDRLRSAIRLARRPQYKNQQHQLANELNPVR